MDDRPVPYGTAILAALLAAPLIIGSALLLVVLNPQYQIVLSWIMGAGLQFLIVRWLTRRDDPRFGPGSPPP